MCVGDGKQVAGGGIDPSVDKVQPVGYFDISGRGNSRRIIYFEIVEVFRIWTGNGLRGSSFERNQALPRYKSVIDFVIPIPK